MEMSCMNEFFPAVIVYPAIDPVALRLGPLSVHWYGLAYVAAFIISGLLIRHFARRWELGLSDDDVVLMVIYAIVGVIVGSRIGYVLIYGGSEYWANPMRIFALWDGGMAFHGGLAGILTAGYLAARSLKMPFLSVCDLGAIGAPSGFLFGRIANFINGELWGRTSDVPWAMVFPNAGGVPRHPSQLYEALLEGAVLLTVMILLARKLPPRPRGQLLGALLVMYGSFRIAVEFFRQPDTQLGFLPGGATMGQLLSIPVLVAGIALLAWSARTRLPQLGPRR
jgi:phosphatidylglycerol:prolipoprotein diacylglycerol transferase